MDIEFFPERPSDAALGSEFYARVEHMPIPAREEEIFQEIASGNVPSFVRKLHEVPVTDPVTKQSARVLVTGDYLAIGSDDDFLRVPMSPLTAQRLADAFGVLLPTKKLVDDIYAISSREIAIPMPPPGPAMMLMPRILAHHRAIEESRRGALGDLVAGHKKDVVVTVRLAEVPQRVAIYGFFRENGAPWQPMQLPHEDSYSDYSHGIRFVLDKVLFDDDTELSLTEVLSRHDLAGLVSSEGVIANPRYKIHAVG